MISPESAQALAQHITEEACRQNNSLASLVAGLGDAVDYAPFASPEFAEQIERVAALQAANQQSIGQ